MYRYILLPQAVRQLEYEIGYSQHKWGNAHATKYRRELMQQVQKIAKQPSLYAIKPEFGENIRVVRFKGNYIVYRIDEERKEVVIAGFPSIYSSP